MKKMIKAIGLMSGTSGDGIDVSIIESDGSDYFNSLVDYFFSYDEKTQFNIRDIKEKINKIKDLETRKNSISKLEENLTFLHAEAVESILKKFKIDRHDIDLIGFHGQTIFHSYKDKISKQLGNGKLLSKLTNFNIVCNFRNNDIANGGQGAPLTPIFHKLIQKKIKSLLPVVFVNIGGIANITYINNKNEITSYDSGPGNYLIDKFLQFKSNNKIYFDKNGEIASKGSVNEIILENYLSDPFYSLPPPKSLDVNDFSLGQIRGLNTEDSICTLTDVTARTVVDSLSFFKKKPELIILSGGGRKNLHLNQRIKYLSKIKTVDIDFYKLDGDFIESQAFAYLAIRSILKKPISFPGTTGVSKAISGGELIQVK